MQANAPLPPGPLGFPHQPSLPSLRASAAECALCRLILSQVDLVIDEFRVAKQHEYFRENQGADYPTFDMFLTKRRVTGDGFLVLSHSAKAEVVYVLGAVGLSVRDEDPLASVFPGRIVSDEPDNGLKSLRRALIWMQACEQHQGCIVSSSPLPTRVVDVGEHKNSQVIRLFEPPQQTFGRYIALSHCWGSSRLPTTTRENKPQRLEAIGADEMSKSFEDAIAVSRFLGIQYIWIDSLCIVQDDLRDWDREAAEMHSVYLNSFLTISISGAKDGSVGCFPRRPPREYVRIAHTGNCGTRGELWAFALPAHNETRTARYIEMEDEPLSDRAWAFQERVLSPRILHFASDQVYFECLQGFRSEDGLYLPSRYFTLHGSEASVYSPRTLNPDISPQLNLWYSLLWSYGPRKLKKSSDKLPALAGIAARFADELDDQYFAGIWRKTMIEGLWWQGLEISEVEEARQPSWSWAAINGIGATGLSGKWEPLALVLDCHVELEGDNLFGAVKSGWIRMEAPLTPIVLVDSQEQAAESGRDLPLTPKHLCFGTPRVRAGRFEWVRNALNRRSKLVSYGRFDYIGKRHVETEAMAQVEGKMFALALAMTPEAASGNLVTYHSLLVTPVEGEDGKTMRRVGFLIQNLDKMGVSEARSSRTIVTLV